MTEKQKRVLVTGANGFIGKAIVKELLQQGYEVTAFDFAPLADPLFVHPRCQRVQGDLLNQESLSQAAQGCSAVIHLASILGSPDYQKNYQIHVIGTKNLLVACRKNKLSRLIAYSTIAAARENPGAYGATKKEMERLLFSSEAEGLRVTILRPTMVLGYRGKGISTIIKQIKAYPLIIPLVGSGKAKRQPVLLKDIVQLTIALLSNQKTFGKTYTVGGDEVLSFRELVSLAKEELEVKKILLPLPKPFALAVAFFLQKLSAKPEFTLENVRNSTLDEDTDLEILQRECLFQPTPLRQSLREIILEYKKDEKYKKEEP